MAYSVVMFVVGLWFESEPREPESPRARCFSCEAVGRARSV